MARNPIKNPMKGDRIKQCSGLVLEVLNVEQNRVFWVSKCGENDWTLDAWCNRVAKGASVINIGNQE